MIEILKETARYLVCVKPVGTAAQGTQAEAMPQLLSEQLGCDIFPVHRLDQTVGGVMVFGPGVMPGLFQVPIQWYSRAPHSIMLPLSKPALSTLTIFTFVATWNDYLGP